MILAVTGLQRERHLLAGPGVEAVAGGGDHARLTATLDRLAPGMDGIISIGIAGALAPGLRPGDWVVATAVDAGNGVVPTERNWTERLVSRLPRAERGVLLGSDDIAATAARKAALHQTTGAVAVDLESHIAARTARRHGLPFAAARVISDAAHRTLPPAACAGMRRDGTMDLPAVLGSLLANPWQLPALIRTGFEAERAFRALLRGHRAFGARLGAGVAGPNVGKLPSDMV
jgi:hopanoid-associated phosphorylase